MGHPRAQSTFSDLLVGRIGQHWSRIAPDKIALDAGNASLTYRALDTVVARLAARMHNAGVAKGEVVCCLLPGGIAHVVTALAVARVGAVFAPLNPRLTHGELTGLLQVAKPVLAISTSERLEQLREAAARAGCADAKFLLADDISDTSAPVVAMHDGAASLPQVREEDFFSMIFTSGTTGQPRGAVATHRARMIWIMNAAIEYGLSDSDTYLSAMPLVHSAGLTFALAHLYVGARVRIMERFNAAEFLGLIERESITSVLAVPTILNFLADARDATHRSCNLGSLRRVITCGAPLPMATKVRVLRDITPHLYDFYGCTESNSMTVLRPCDQLRKPGSVGRPFTNVEIMIANEAGQALPTGSIGEIWSHNPSTMMHYAGDPEATAAAFSGRWYRTGDLGYLDEGGYLHIVGRAKEMIISGGVNIYPAEIEAVLREHPAVHDCAVVGVPDSIWGQRIKAYVALRDGAALTLRDIQIHCCERLADFKKPREVEIVPCIPRNAGGKAMKSALVQGGGTQVA